jgi:trans-aconitate methyltransferase
MNAEGHVTYIIHTKEDITEQVVADERKEKLKGMEQAYSLFLQAPVPIQIYKCQDLTLELANGHTLAIWDKGPEVIGKPLLEVLPEMQQQGFIDLLLQVMATETPLQLYNTPATFQVNGRQELM